MLPRRIEELLDDIPERWCCQDVFIPRHECCSRRRTAHRPLGGHGVEGWLVAARRGGASGRDDGAAFPRRLSRKNYVRRSPLSNGENSYLKTHARAFESCWLMSTAHVYRLSPILRLLSLYFSKRTNDRTSITGSTGSSPIGSGLHRLANRRKRNRLRPRSKPLWDTAAAAAAATGPATAGGRNPRPWRRSCGGRSPRKWPRGWPMHSHRPRR